MYCLNIACAPSQHHNHFMATVAFGHTHVQSHVPVTQGFNRGLKLPTEEPALKM